MSTGKWVVVAPGCSSHWDLTFCLLLAPLNEEVWLFLLSAPSEEPGLRVPFPKCNSWLEWGVPLMWDRQVGDGQRRERGMASCRKIIYRAATLDQRTELF